jgi:transposase InsO family protein
MHLFAPVPNQTGGRDDEHSSDHRLRAVLMAHQHWHIDVSYVNSAGTFYYLCSILDGFSRYIVNWHIRESITEADIEIILQGAKEKYPGARLRIISDNGPQFIAKDFKEFIRISGMTHVRTSPFYPQSNGKIERWHKSLKGGSASGQERRCRSMIPGVLVSGYVDHYNNVCLNSATCYITPKDMLAARDPRGARPEVGGGAEATANSSAASRLTCR